MMQLLWRRLCPAALFLAGIFSFYASPQFVVAEDFDSVFSRPVVVGERTVFYLTRAEDGIWTLASREIASAAGPAAVPLRLDAAYADLRLFVDNRDNLWLAGQELQPGEAMIRLGRLDNLGFAESRTIGVPAGWNGQADLTFPGLSNPWIAWLHKSGAGEDILVEDTTSGLRWRLTSPGTSALSSPRIRADRNGGIWVLWTGLSEGRYVVAGRRFDGREWSDEVRIDDNGERPCFQLEARIGP